MKADPECEKHLLFKSQCSQCHADSPFQCEQWCVVDTRASCCPLTGAHAPARGNGWGSPVGTAVPEPRGAGLWSTTVGPLLPTRPRASRAAELPGVKEVWGVGPTMPGPF